MKYHAKLWDTGNPSEPLEDCECDSLAAALIAARGMVVDQLAESFWTDAQRSILRAMYYGFEEARRPLMLYVGDPSEGDTIVVEVTEEVAS